MGLYNAIVDAFVDAAQAIVHEVASVDLEIEAYEVTGSSTLGGEMLVSMDLPGEQEGFIAISLEKQLAEYLVSEMLKVDETDVAPDELLDGLEELLNMIAGAAKTTLEETPDGFNLSLPSAIRCGGAEIVSPPQCEGVIARCRIGADPFILSIWRSGIAG